MSKNRNTIAIFLLICTVAAFVLAVNSSAASAASITGQVLDKDNKPVQQAIVTLYFNQSKVDIAGNPALTAANGSYKIAGVTSKVYSLTVEKNSFSYSETVIINDNDVIVNITLPGHTAALATTPSPVITPTPPPTPTPTPTMSPTATPTPVPSSTAQPSPGFGLLIGLAGAGLAIAIRKR